MKGGKARGAAFWAGQALLLAFLVFSVFEYDRLARWLAPLIGKTPPRLEVWSLPELFAQHLAIVALASGAAFILAFGLASLVHIRRMENLKRTLVSVCGFGVTFPTAALIALAVPLLGYGRESVVLALFIYGLMPVFINTIEGLESAPAEIREAADGMGFSPWERFLRIELPLGMPMVLAGLRVSLIISIAAASIGAVVGAGGLGMPIISGIRIFEPVLILKGALPLTLLALLVDSLLRRLENTLGAGNSAISHKRKGITT
jgi:osmoprotectant transport system permease protein